MPTVEKTSGGRYTNRDIPHVGLGDRIEVSDAMADYLCDDLDEFETVVATCQEVKDDGEICGRELPCGYHSDTDNGKESD